MKLLIIGSGGREHALAWRLAQAADVGKIYIAPGNTGTAHHAPLMENLPLTDLTALADFAEREKIHLTVVGPEAPLAAGIVDLFRARGLKIFGPHTPASSAKARRSSSKPTGWPPARASSSLQRLPKHTAPSITCSPAQRPAHPAPVS